jgi:hypothetical protein
VPVPFGCANVDTPFPTGQGGETGPRPKSGEKPGSSPSVQTGLGLGSWSGRGPSPGNKDVGAEKNNSSGHAGRTGEKLCTPLLGGVDENDIGG